MPDNSLPAPPADFEAALAQLQAIVQDLEDGELGLESSLLRFESGVSLLRSCYQYLEQAERRIEILTGTDDRGEPITAPFDASASDAPADAAPRKPGRRRAPPKPADPANHSPADVADDQRLF